MGPADSLATSHRNTTCRIKMKEITIDSFAGGRANFVDQSLIQPNTCASGSMNVWAPEGSLIKAPGFVLQSSFTASGTGNAPCLWSDDSVSTANFLFYRIGLSATGGGVGPGGGYPFASGITFTDTLNPLGYTTGTVSVSGANLVSATGNGTLWLANVTAGDRINFSTVPNGWYNVASVQDDTHLTLTLPVTAAIPTGTTYTIQPKLTFQEVSQASINGYLCYVTTGDYMQAYDGNGMLRFSAAPAAAYLTNFKNYLFAARTSTASSRLYWSAIKDPTTWPSNNFLDVDQKYGQISGMAAYGTELIIFKTRGMYKVVGDVFDPSNPQYYVQKINTPPDFVFGNNRSVAIHNGKLTFYGFGRVYQYTIGTFYITDISQNIIRDLPTAFSTLTDSMGSLDQRILGISYNGYYILSGFQDPAQSSYNGCLVMDRNNSWWYLSNRNGRSSSVDMFGAGQMSVVQSATSRPQLAVLMGTYPKVFTWDFIGPTFGLNYFDTPGATQQSSAVAINGQWISKEFNIDFGTFKEIVVYVKKQSAGNLTVQWSIDQATAVSTTLDMTTGRGQIIRGVFPINQKGSTIQITLSNNTASQGFKVYAVKIRYEESPMERLY